MARTRSMTRNRNHNDDDDASSSSTKRPKSCASWSDLNHDLVNIVMMKLGFGDYYSFRRVCKSWRSLACKNENIFMASMPPMSVRISSDAHQKACYLEDFQGRKYKTFLPHSAVGECAGVTCGYLIFFTKKTCDFLLVNPITRKELHFPGFPFNYRHASLPRRAILVFSPSISALVLVVLHNGEIMSSVPGKGAWNYVYLWGFHFYDLYAFKGKIYTLTYNFRGRGPLNERFCLCELRLNVQPKVCILEIKNPDLFYPHMFVSSGESLYVMRLGSEILNGLHELDLGQMKWIKPCEETTVEYAFFSSVLNHVGVAVKRESWADPRSLGGYASFPNTDHNGNIWSFIANMWYVPRESQNVDRIDE